MVSNLGVDADLISASPALADVSFTHPPKAVTYWHSLRRRTSARISAEWLRPSSSSSRASVVSTVDTNQPTSCRHADGSGLFADHNNHGIGFSSHRPRAARWQALNRYPNRRCQPAEVDTGCNDLPSRTTTPMSWSIEPGRNMVFSNSADNVALITVPVSLSVPSRPTSPPMAIKAPMRFLEQYLPPARNH